MKRLFLSMGSVKKKILATLMLAGTMVIAPVPVAQAQAGIQPDLVSLSFIYSGTVVNVQDYVNIREKPDVRSRIVAQAPRGARLSLRYTGNQQWWQVLLINGDNYGVRAGDAIGYVHADFVKTH